MKDLGLLTLRVAAGGLLAGHGAQKLFGSFGGYGLEGTAGWLESMGLKPGRRWAMLAGASELGGGLLTALGLGGPIGPIMTMGAMGMATTTAHRGKPIWVSAGGAELPATNMAVATALTLTGPGAISLDKLFRVHVPWWMTGLTLLATASGVAIGTQAHSQFLADSAQTPAEADATETEAADELQAHRDAKQDATAKQPTESERAAA